MFDSADMFRAFQPHRDKAIVLVTGTAGRDWREISDNETRDLTLQGAMGQTNSAALGFALSQPNEKVVLFDSEGSLQMNMGILGTIAGKKPKNFFHFLMDNECYATTGGQPVPNASEINYAGMAREAGYTATFQFDNLEEFTNNIEAIMKEEGPVDDSQDRERAHRAPGAETPAVQGRDHQGVAGRTGNNCRLGV